MSYENILVERPAPRVASITLNHPPRLNAINGDMLRELDRAVRRIERDDEVRAWLLTGADGAPARTAERNMPPAAFRAQPPIAELAGH